MDTNTPAALEEPIHAHSVAAPSAASKDHLEMERVAKLEDAERISPIEATKQASPSDEGSVPIEVDPSVGFPTLSPMRF
jgi:hypothetical protein